MLVGTLAVVFSFYSLVQLSTPEEIQIQKEFPFEGNTKANGEYFNSNEPLYK